jgi:hypothetical protein
VDEQRRNGFPNNFVGDLVATDRGWVVVPPTCCPDGHDYGEPGWSVSSVWCTCNDRHMAGDAGAAGQSTRRSPARSVTDGALALSQLPEAADYTAGRASQRQLMRLLLAHREEVAF